MMYNHVTYLTNPGGIPHSYIFRRNTFKNRNQHKVSWCIPRYSVGIAQKGLEESETEGWNPVSTEWGKPSAFSTSGTSKGWMQARQRPGVMLKRSTSQWRICLLRWAKKRNATVLLLLFSFWSLKMNHISWRRTQQGINS